MAKAKKASKAATAVEKPKSEALKEFETNLDSVMALLNAMRSHRLVDAGKALERVVKKEIASGPKLNVKRLSRAVDKLTAVVDEYLAFERPALQSMVVLLVSYIEAYMESCLVSVARRHPQFVKLAEFDCQRVFELGSIEDLRNEILSNWAHNALRPGGPETWYRRLRSMGAPSLDQNAVRGVQHLWDTRNLIVHSRSIATPAYAKKHAHMKVPAGKPVAVTLSQFGGWLPHVKQFVEHWADGFLLKFLSAKSETEPKPV